MKALIEKIRNEGQNMGNGILRVNSFINHQIDPVLMLAAGGAFAAKFGGLGINRVLTVETSGIAPGMTTALALGIPVVFARKVKPVTMPKDVYLAKAFSRTKGSEVSLMVSPEFLRAGDRILIIDDFLASGSQIVALTAMVRDAGADVVGVGTLIEKQFEGGRDRLVADGLHVESLAIITHMSDTELVFAEGD